MPPAPAPVTSPVPTSRGSLTRPSCCLLLTPAPRSLATFATLDTGQTAARSAMLPLPPQATLARPCWAPAPSHPSRLAADSPSIFPTPPPRQRSSRRRLPPAAHFP